MRQADKRISTILDEVRNIVPTLRSTNSLLDGVRQLGMPARESEKLSGALLALSLQLRCLEAVLRNLAEQGAAAADRDQADLPVQ